MNIPEKILTYIFGLLPVKKNKIFFMSHYGAEYSCSPRFFSEYIKEMNSEGIKQVWCFVNPEKYNLPGIIKTRFHSINCFYHLATSRVIVQNCRSPHFFKKRKNQFYLQTWHSSLRLKGIEQEVESSLKPEYVGLAKRDSKMIDLWISGCRKSTETYKNYCWYTGEILETGTPRGDSLFKVTSEQVDVVRKELGLTENQQYILYAPTFRKDHGLEIYKSINWKKILANLKQSTGTDYKIVIRLHPHLREFQAQLTQQSDVFLDGSKVSDLTALLKGSACTVSDYSGLIFDCIYLDTPVVLYVPDYVEYTHTDRKLKFTLEELPFAVATDNTSLATQILAIVKQETDFQQKYTQFLQTIGSKEDGYACQRIYEIITAKLWKRK